MNVASLELCKELYELSGWETGTTGFCHHSNGMVAFGWMEGATPAYDLGYLLRKLAEVGVGVRYVLPEPYDSIDHTMKEWHGKFIASTPDRKLRDYPYAYTPENAAAKLAIQLFKQGILTKEA